MSEKAASRGPPAADGVVEITYGVVPDYQGKGYATEAAQALAVWAFSSGQVRVVRAHTFAEANASARVLTKCGFMKIGEVVDREDGLVWRWEKQIEGAVEPDTAPNGGPATPSGNPNVVEGPPSVT